MSNRMKTIRFREAGYALACSLYLEAEGFPSVWMPSDGRHVCVTMAPMTAIRSALGHLGMVV